MEVCKSYLMGDESKNMNNSVGERYSERLEIKVMNDYYCNLLSSDKERHFYRKSQLYTRKLN